MNEFKSHDERMEQPASLTSEPIDLDNNEDTSNINPQLFVIQSRQSEAPRHASEKGADLNYEKSEETYPEGGRAAWTVVLGSWLALVSSLGLMNTIATLQIYISKHQLANYSQGTIGWIFSIYTFLSFFLGVYIGPVFDKFGPRWLVVSGTLCLVTSLMLLSICSGKLHSLTLMKPR